MNLNLFRRYVIHTWDCGDGKQTERIHYSRFRGTKDRLLRRFYRDDFTETWFYGNATQYESYEKIKRTNRIKKRHR